MKKLSSELSRGELLLMVIRLRSHLAGLARRPSTIMSDAATITLAKTAFELSPEDESLVRASEKGGEVPA